MSGDGIYERDRSPYWWASWVDGSGRQARRSTGVKKKDDPRKLEAKKIRASFMLEVSLKKKIVMKKPVSFLWDDLVMSYLSSMDGRLKNSTIKRYEHAVKHLFGIFSGLPADIDRSSAREYIAARMAEGAKPSTINKEIAFMQGCYSWAQLELDWSIDNPWKGRTLPVNNERRRFLTREEADQLIHAASQSVLSAYLADFIRLALNTGMRPGEILALSWDRVDMDNGLILFGAEDHKSGKLASIPINAGARLALLSRREFRKQRGIASRYVFTDNRGNEMKSIRKGFATACGIAGLEDVHPHDLRRTFASWLVQDGVSIQMVSGLLRHADISITHAVYAHLNPEQFRAAAATLDARPALKIVNG